jgi:hypothetical protein
MVCRIQDNLKAVKSCQESYANKRHRSLEFEVEDHVYLKVSPMKGVKRFETKGKLTPRYIGPFPILKKCGTVAYELKLPPSLAGVHDIVHISHPQVLQGTCGCCIAGSDIAQSGYDLSRANDQDLGSEGSCH